MRAEKAEEELALMRRTVEALSKENETLAQGMADILEDEKDRTDKTETP